MFDKASKKLGMENAVFQKGAFGIDDDEQATDSKMSKEDIEKLLRQGAFAFLNDGDGEETEDITTMKIEDILANKGKERKPGKDKK